MSIKFDEYPGVPELSVSPESRDLWITYSTVTDFARLRGWSTSVPFNTAT